MTKKNHTKHEPSPNSLAARLPAEQALQLASTSVPWSKAPRRTSENDLAVDRLAKAMKARFARLPIAGWDDPRKYSIELLAKMLGESLCDGDPVHVAAVAATLFGRRADKKLVAEHAMRALLQGSREAAAAQVEKQEKLLRELSNIVHDFTVVMQTAWIEWQHGAGAEAAMSWIHNTLAGPGHIPDENAPYGKEAQAYFDANQHDPLPTCFCGRPSNIGWMKQGFCSDAHYDEAQTRLAEEASTAG